MTKPVAEIVAEIMNDNWPNHTGGCVCNYADVEACLTPIIAELTRLTEENERLKGLLHSGKQVMKHYNADKTPIGISGYKDGFKSVE